MSDCRLPLPRRRAMRRITPLASRLTNVLRTVRSSQAAFSARVRCEGQLIPYSLA